MTPAALRKVQPGDIVSCDVHGRKFLAYAGGHDTRFGDSGLIVDPIPGRGSAVTTRFVTSGDVEDFYVKASRPRSRKTTR